MLLHNTGAAPIARAFVVLLMLYLSTIIVKAQCPCPYASSLDTVQNVPIVIHGRTYFVAVEYCTSVFPQPLAVNPCDSERPITSMSSIRKVKLPEGKLLMIPNDSILQAVLCMAGPNNGNIFNMATFRQAPIWRWSIGLPVCTRRQNNTIEACSDSPCIFVRQDYEFHKESKQVIPSSVTQHNCRLGVETCTSECSPSHFAYTLAGC